LEWFLRHRQLEVPWSALQVADDARLVTAAKGIYKPAGSDYALSVSQRLSSPYEDDLTELLREGGGRARYHQEGPSTTKAPYSSFTNRGLIRCMEDEMPVGVLVQVLSTPALYSIVGLAHVVSWEKGIFLLERTDGVERGEAAERPVEQWQPPADDTRERVRASVIRRRGQPAFRARMLTAYRGRCALTAVDAPQALEAAHITPYSGPKSNEPQNGLLLRADIHALFDLGLLAIESKKMTCLIDPSLTSPDYARLSGRALFLPAEKSDRPSSVALDQHREWAGL
jgi:hypothetical protein